MFSKRKLVKIAALSTLLLGAAALAEDTKILFVAGKKSHGYFSHEHNAGSLLLAKALDESGLNFDASVYHDPEDPGWPRNRNLLEGIKAVVIYCDGGKRHVANNHVAVSSARVNSSRFITSATVPRRNDEENGVQDEDPYLGTKIEIQLMEGQPDPEIKDQNEYPDWLWGLLEDQASLQDLGRRYDAGEELTMKEIQRILKLHNRGKIKSSNEEGDGF